ncbi:hypothetical protein K7X08_020731 [Anisodus acutangulus]|uniref:Uncharacterized protein n=1 Tax=Anisodus acutangulus TaxID=402998 RepID=A0A9Q1MU14_9SOLA|nr:hypothetical protein K7X08_020731 [Anisodus acutangulus]
MEKWKMRNLGRDVGRHICDAITIEVKGTVHEGTSSVPIDEKVPNTVVVADNNTEENVEDTNPIDHDEEFIEASDFNNTENFEDALQGGSW